jgi:peroxiredoxin Q/BCP
MKHLPPASPAAASLAFALALGPLGLVACASQPGPAPVTTAPTSAGAAGAPAPATPSPAAPAAAAAAPAAAPAAGPVATAASAASAATATAAATAPPASGEDLVGKPAPDFSAPAHDGTTFHLAAAKGKPVVLYFYPRDETPGCTKEACSFRDAWVALAKTGAVLVGISADNTESHKAFVAHWKLPFSLVTDADGAIAKQFGVPFEGRHQRQTVVIGADGTVKKVYRKVDVAVHASQVLDDLKNAHAS